MTRTYTGTPMAPDHALGGIYRVMDRHGMLPDDWFCGRCAKPLNADGNHPAEIYAGTFNGLCYGCTSAGPYVAAVTALDGCRRVSWPPHSPSWRRDRESHYGYEGCGTCGGMGIVLPAYRSPDNGGGKSCPDCLARYAAHPQRAGWSQWSERIMQSCQAAFERAWDYYAGTPKKCTAKRREELRAAFAGPDREHQTPEFAELKAAYMAGYRRVRELVSGCFAHDEWVPVTEDPRAFWLSYCKWRQLDPDNGLAYGYPDGFRYAWQPKPLCTRHRMWDGCKECLARVLMAQTLGRVEDWHRSGQIPWAAWQAYAHVWATSAYRYSAIPAEWADEPADPEVIEMAALMRRAAEERKAAS